MKELAGSAQASQHQFPITPEAFWTAFSKALQSRWSPEVDEGFADPKFWTPFMTALLTDIVKGLGCHVDCEYWPRVDVSGFNCCCGEWAEWSREVAIEHEGGADWKQELCKLFDINAGLKVLIAYPGHMEFHEMLERLPAVYWSRKYVTSPCKYLFIVGPGTDFDDFKGFAFDGSSVTEITGGIRIVPEPLR